MAGDLLHKNEDEMKPPRKPLDPKSAAEHGATSPPAVPRAAAPRIERAGFDAPPIPLPPSHPLHDECFEAIASW